MTDRITARDRAGVLREINAALRKPASIDTVLGMVEQAITAAEEAARAEEREDCADIAAESVKRLSLGYAGQMAINAACDIANKIRARGAK